MVNEAPQRRLVILGASNVVRSFPQILAAAHQPHSEPLDVLAAIGHGRGFGMSSRVLGRQLPPILACGLWKGLEERAGRSGISLVTDIGNELAFGALPEQIAGWVALCLDRLAPHSDEIILTELPMASLEEIGPVRFRLARQMLFPRSRLTWETARSMSRELNAAVIELAARYHARLARPEREWYGWDPIHVRRRLAGSAWCQVLGAGEIRADASAQWRRQLRWWPWSPRPELRHVFGVEQRCSQPAVRLAGSWISLY